MEILNKSDIKLLSGFENIKKYKFRDIKQM